MCCRQTLFHVPQSSVSKDSPFLSVTDRRAGPGGVYYSLIEGFTR